MHRGSRTIRVTGVLGKDGHIRLDKAVPLPPGPVDIRLAPCKQNKRTRRRKLDLLDLRGVGKELWSRIDVDQYIRQSRAEWDRDSR